MRKKIVTLVLISALSLFAACAGSNNKVIPTPTIQARPMEVVPATATPIAEVTVAPTATPTATAAPTATEAPTLQPTPTTAPTATLAPTTAPTATLAPTTAPTVTLAPTTAPTVIPTPTTAPTVTPTPTLKVAYNYTKGMITDTGYENEWLGLRFTTLKNATITRDSETWMTARLEDGTVVQLLAEPVDYENMTAEEAASELKKELVKDSDSEISFAVNDYYTLEEIAEKEYIGFFCTMTTLNTQLKQEYCVREQDGYLIYVVFSYKDATGLSEAKDAFSPY